MKLVFVAFDSVSHQPKSTNMISMTQNNNYKIDSSYIDDINTLNDIYDTYKPDVLLLDTTFGKKDLMDFISKTQQELQSDILGVGSKIHQKDPKKWAGVNGYWEEIYPTLEFEVDVKIEINSVGDIANLKD